jgi:hypothetical protein
MTSLVCQMVVGKAQTMNACGVCLVEGHLTNMCPTIKKEPIEQVNMTTGFLGQTQRKYNPSSRMYNKG